MASLFNTQINNTYQGLLKTDSNGVIGAGLNLLTDGLGNSAGISLDPANSKLHINGTAAVSPRFELKDNKTGNLSWFVPFDLLDSTGTRRGQINFDEYSSFNLVAGQIGQFNDPELIIQNTGKVGASAKIAVQNDTVGNAYLSPNNSDNWYLGYQQSVDALSYNSGTGDLTLGRQDAADLVVNIPSGGGGGTPGLVNGSFGLNSLKNADHLVNPSFPANASAEHTIALGMNASATQTGGVALGLSASAFAQYAVAISPGADSRGFGDVSIGYNSDTIGGTGNNVAIGRDAESRGVDGGVIGALSRVQSGNSNFIIARNCTIPSGQGNASVGASNITFPTGQNDNVLLGRVSTIGAGTSNSIAIGLVSNMYANCNDSVAIGRSAQVGTLTTGSTNSVAIGRDAKATQGGNATAVGYNSLAQASNATAIGANAIAANANWTATPQLELTNYATLNFADDAAAATGGVPLGGIYHNAGALRIRIV